MTLKSLDQIVGLPSLCKLVSRHVLTLITMADMAHMANFKAKYSQKLALQSAQAPNDECVLWTGATSRSKGTEYGVIRCKWKDRWRRYYVHRLALIFDRGYHLEDLEKGMDVSHLCHNALCITPSHLSYEPHRVNRVRSACVTAGVCTNHFGLFPPCLLHLKFNK